MQRKQCDGGTLSEVHRSKLKEQFKAFPSAFSMRSTWCAARVSYEDVVTRFSVPLSIIDVLLHTELLPMFTYLQTTTHSAYFHTTPCIALPLLSTMSSFGKVVALWHAHWCEETEDLNHSIHPVYTVALSTSYRTTWISYHKLDYSTIKWQVTVARE